jgi:AAA15 family ATPase/GTPase
MKLIGFRIQNIKSIKDSGWCRLSDHDNITVFAGQNEAGKSAILEGLNFFRNGTTPEFERLSKRSDDLHPFVECEFLLEDIDRQGDPDILELLKKINTIKMYRGNTSQDDYKELKLSPESTEIINVEVLNKLKHGNESDSKNETDKTEESDSTSEEVVEPIPSAEPALDENDLHKELYQHIVNHLPEFIYYDSFSSILPGIVKLSDIGKSKAIDDFQKVFGINFPEVFKKGVQARSSEKFKVVEKATVDLNSYWKQRQTTEEDDHYQYEINLVPNEADPTQSSIEFLIHRNDGVSLFIEQKSKGFQWFSSFNLRLKALGVDVKSAHKYLILIDEPGQGLHETAQTDVKSVLEELAENGMQIIYSTHNPCLIGVTDREILRIRLVFQTRDDGTKIKNITQYCSIEGSQDALSPIITAMGINSIGQLLDRTTPCVVLEGITDHYYLSAMKIALDIKDNYSFIPAVGVPNIRPLISILIGWGANYRAVFDEGTAGKRIYRELAKYLFPDDDKSLMKHVMKLEGFDGIEDLFDKDDFDKYIIGSNRSDKTIKNSELAKTHKKELIARLFLEQVKITEKPLKLSKITKANFQKVFDWLKK